MLMLVTIEITIDLLKFEASSSPHSIKHVFLRWLDIKPFFFFGFSTPLITNLFKLPSNGISQITLINMLVRHVVDKFRGIYKF